MKSYLCLSNILQAHHLLTIQIHDFQDIWQYKISGYYNTFQSINKITMNFTHSIE